MIKSNVYKHYSPEISFHLVRTKKEKAKYFTPVHYKAFPRFSEHLKSFIKVFVQNSGTLLSAHRKN